MKNVQISMIRLHKNNITKLIEISHKKTINISRHMEKLEIVLDADSPKYYIEEDVLLFACNLLQNTLTPPFLYVT